MSKRGGPRSIELKQQNFEEIERRLDLRINAERIRARAAPLSLLHRSDQYSKKQSFIKKSLRAINRIANSSIADIDISQIIRQNKDGAYEIQPHGLLQEKFGTKAASIVRHSKDFLTLYKVFRDKEKTKIVISDPSFWQSMVVNADVASSFLERHKDFIINGATGTPGPSDDPGTKPFLLETVLSITNSVLSDISKSSATDPLQLGESIAKIYNKASRGEYFDEEGKIKKREMPGTNLVDDLIEFAGPMVGGAALSSATKKENLDRIFDCAGYMNILQKKKIELSPLSIGQNQALKEDIDLTTEVITGVKSVIGEFLNDTATIRRDFFQELSENPHVREKLTDLLNAKTGSEVLQSFSEFKKSSKVVKEIFEVKSESSAQLSESLAKAASASLGTNEHKEVIVASMPLLLGIVANIAASSHDQGVERAISSGVRNAGLVMNDREFLRTNRRSPHQIDESAIKAVMHEDGANLASSVLQLLSTDENKRLFREVLPEVIRKNREAFVAVFNNVIEKNTPADRPKLVSGEEIVDMLSNRGTVQKIIEVADSYFNHQKKGIAKKVAEVLQDTPHTKTIAKRAIWHGVKSFFQKKYSAFLTSAKKLFGTKEKSAVESKTRLTIADSAAANPKTARKQRSNIRDALEGREIDQPKTTLTQIPHRSRIANSQSTRERA